MTYPAQSGNFPEASIVREGVSWVDDISRISNRTYYELADDARVMKGWTKVKCAEEARVLARRLKCEYEPKNEAVYDWFSGESEPRSTLTKLMEMVLSINLPFTCYYNVGKR